MTNNRIKSTRSHHQITIWKPRHPNQFKPEMLIHDGDSNTSSVSELPVSTSLSSIGWRKISLVQCINLSLVGALCMKLIIDTNSSDVHYRMPSGGESFFAKRSTYLSHCNWLYFPFFPFQLVSILPFVRFQNYSYRKKKDNYIV